MYPARGFEEKTKDPDLQKVGQSVDEKMFIRLSDYSDKPAFLTSASLAEWTYSAILKSESIVRIERIQPWTNRW